MGPIVTPIVVLSSVGAGLAIILVLAERYLASYGECRIKVEGEKEIVVEGGETLLASLMDNGIFVPSACGGKGTCGTCKVQIFNKGAGEPLATEIPYLSKEDLENGFRLSCLVKVKNDLEVSVPKIHEFRTIVTKIEDLTHDIKSIIFELQDGETIDFKPGQYVMMRMPGTEEEPVMRAYSIASKPSDNHVVELLIRLVPGGLMTTYVFTELKVGDEVYLSGPYGEFYLREDSDKDIICVGGGSGVAPIKSIITHLFEKDTDRKVTYYFGARAVKDLYFYKECLELKEKYPNFRFITALSDLDEGDQWDGDTGFIHLVIEKYLEDGEDMESYMCGPPPMIDAAIDMLVEKDMDEDDIYFDKF